MEELCSLIVIKNTYIFALTLLGIQSLRIIRQEMRVEQSNLAITILIFKILLLKITQLYMEMILHHTHIS